MLNEEKQEIKVSIKADKRFSLEEFNKTVDEILRRTKLFTEDLEKAKKIIDENASKNKNVAAKMDFIIYLVEDYKVMLNTKRLYETYRRYDKAAEVLNILDEIDQKEGK